MAPKKTSELRPGDVFVIDVPCRVVVRAVEHAEGNIGRGDIRIVYVNGGPIAKTGELYIGSALSVDVIAP